MKNARAPSSLSKTRPYTTGSTGGAETTSRFTACSLVSGRPVVTTSDAGGPLEFVRDQETGRVCAPEPEAIGRALGELLADSTRARRLGALGRAEISGISWDEVIRRLTEVH